MQKKIIAIACVVIITITMFASCNKNKLYMKEINGIMRPVVTDENGELVTNHEGEIAVYQTNTNHEIVTDENGESCNNYVAAPEAYVSNGKLKIEFFEMKIPDGFSANSIGWMTKDKTDGACYIKAAKVDSVDTENTFQEYLDKVIDDNGKIIEYINSGKASAEGYEKAESGKKDVTLWGKVPANYIDYTVYSEDGKIVHYAVNIYFIIGEEIWSLNYACEEGKGYDESFDFLDWVQNDVVFNEN